MISYFTIALHVYNTLFEQTYKFQFKVIFGQDSFPQKRSPFQVGQSFAEHYELSPCKSMVEYLLLPVLFFHIKVFHLFPLTNKHLLCRKIFLFCQKENFGGLP